MIDSASIHIRNDGWLSQPEKFDEPTEMIQSCNNLALISFHNIKESSCTLTELTYIEPLYKMIDEALDDCLNFKNSSGNRVMALNSIAFIIEIMHPVLNHAQAYDKSLLMIQGPSIDDKMSHYLLCTRVYSTVTRKQFENLKRRYRYLVECIIKPLTTSFGPEPWIQASSEKILQELSACFNLDNMNSPSQTFEHSLHPFLYDDPVVYQKAQELDHIYIRPLGRRLEEAALLDFSIKRLQEELDSVILSYYPGSKLTIYGSCLSDLSLHSVSDVDISISIPRLKEYKVLLDQKQISEQRYSRHLNRFLYIIQRLLVENPKCTDVHVISKARIPLIKGRIIDVGNPLTADGSISFDLCFLNDIAVANSSLLREYSLIDERVKLLMLAVKLWAKRNDIASAADKTISSYAWMNLVIFFLQCIEFTPNLQCPSLMSEHDFIPDPNHFIDQMNTAFLTNALIKQRQLWTQSMFERTPVSLLLYGFFSFYTSLFPHYFMSVSIKEGRLALTKFSFRSSTLWRLSIEDPFETHDSKHPHDLGTPLNNKGQTQITIAFRNSAENLRQFFLGDRTDVDIFASDTANLSHEDKNTKPISQRSKKRTKNKRTKAASKDANRQKAHQVDVADNTEVLPVHVAEDIKSAPSVKSQFNRSNAEPELTDDAVEVGNYSRQSRRKSRRRNRSIKEENMRTESATTYTKGTKAHQVDVVDSTKISPIHIAEDIESASPVEAQIKRSNAEPEHNGDRRSNRSIKREQKKRTEAATTDANGPKTHQVDVVDSTKVLPIHIAEDIESAPPVESQIKRSNAEPEHNGDRRSNRSIKRAKKKRTEAATTDANGPKTHQVDVVDSNKVKPIHIAEDIESAPPIESQIKRSNAESEHNGDAVGVGIPSQEDYNKSRSIKRAQKKRTEAATTDANGPKAHQVDVVDSNKVLPMQIVEDINSAPSVESEIKGSNAESKNNDGAEEFGEGSRQGQRKSRGRNRSIKTAQNKRTDAITINANVPGDDLSKKD